MSKKTGQKQTAKQIQRSEFLEELRGWSPLIGIAAAILLLWLGFVRHGAGVVEARVLLVGFPIGVLIYGLSVVREQPRSLLVAGVALAVLGAAAAEARTLQVLLPPDAYDATTVTEATPDGTLAVPDSATAFDIVVHADLESSGTERSVEYDLVVRRGDARADVRGRLARDVVRGKGGGVRLHETERHAVELGGTGPLRVHLVPRSGSADGGLRVAAAPAMPYRTLVDLVLLAALGGAFVLQCFIRRGTGMLTVPLGMLVAFGFTIERLFNPDDLLKFSLGTGLLAMVGGGIGGWLLGAVAGRYSPWARPPDAGPRLPSRHIRRDDDDDDDAIDPDDYL